LKPSKGEAARDAQIREAKGGETEATTDKKESPRTATVTSVDKKEWAVGDFCRSTFSEDKAEYEGKLTSVEVDAEGNQYGLVVYIGYENEETQWLTELKPSNGPEARSKQIREAKTDSVATPEVHNTDEKLHDVKKVAGKAHETKAAPKAEQVSKATKTVEPKANGVKEQKAGERAQQNTNNNAAQVEIQSTQIQQLEQKINELCNENKNLQLQVQSIGQCNRELLKEKTELQQKIEAGPNASAETDVAVMNIALYKEKIKGLEARVHDLSEKFNESVKMNNKLISKIDKLTKELETARSSGGNPKADERNISTSSVEELNRTPLMPSGNPASMNAIIPNGMGMFPMSWNGMPSSATGDGLPPGMVMMPMMYPMMYPLAGSAPPGAPVAGSRNAKSP